MNQQTRYAVHAPFMQDPQFRPARRPWAAHRAAPVVLLALVALLTACVAQQPGVPRAPADDPAAGLLTLPDGRSIPVYPEALRYDGQAHFRWPDGRLYEGAWQNGQPHGMGTERRPDGEQYTGAWEAGQRRGRGELILPDGQRYIGDFQDGLRAGQGLLRHEDGVYRGQWADDQPNGHGEYHGDDGRHYSGEWRDGQRFGHGVFRGPDGARYEGDWAHDQPDGFGTMTTPDGGTYEGEWQLGQRQGYGRAEGPPDLVYEGTWLAGEPHGYGRQTRPDGSRYLGGWQRGERHGQGRETHPDGSWHDGVWSENQPHGPGLRHTANGIEISGVWNQDVVATGLLHLPTGLEYAGRLFRDGTRGPAPELLAWLTRGAEHGDPYAQLFLATLHQDASDPAASADDARRWLEAAADAGLPEACYRLALEYQDSNPPRALELLSAAAERGHAKANERLGDRYATGDAVPQNTSRAIRYYERGMAAGSTEARHRLARLLATAPTDAHRDPVRAVQLIRSIALHTGSWHYLDTLAAAHAANGEFELAAGAQRQAIAAALDVLGSEGDGTPELEAMQHRLNQYQQHSAPGDRVSWAPAARP